MLRPNIRLLLLLVLILLFVVAPVMAAPTLTLALSHTGDSGVNFSTGGTR